MAMPIYEYTCSDCKHQFELIQKITDAPVKQCPKCLGFNAAKMISSAGFQLKGTGWYATDFKNKSSDSPSKDKVETPKKSEE